MSGDRWIGDNPLVHIRPPTCILSSPTFYHRYGYGNMLMTILFPLTISGRPLFYYIRFPDNKGTLSIRCGETTIGSVSEGFYPPSTKNRVVI